MKCQPELVKGGLKTLYTYTGFDKLNLTTALVRD